MLGPGYITCAYDRGSLKRKYEAYNQARTRPANDPTGGPSIDSGVSAEQIEWAPAKDKCTMLLLGPNDVGKAFLVNTLLSSSYETSRGPTLGTHRQTSQPLPIQEDIQMQDQDNSNTNNRKRDSQEVDKEFLVDESFNRGSDWERERMLEMQEIYATSQYHITRSHVINDECAFVIPQGKAGDSYCYVVSYGRIPQLLVNFIDEPELRRILWQLHENTQNPAKTILSPARRDFIAYVYRACIEGCSHPGSVVPLPSIASAAELPIHENVRSLLGKVYKYSGNGADPIVDRIYIRARIKHAISTYGIFLKTLNIRLPCSILQGGRKELIILSDTTAHGHIRSAHIVQAINNANLLLLGVDSKGLTNEMGALLLASKFLEKVATNNDNVIFLDLSERSSTRRGNNTPTPLPPPSHVKDILTAQFKRVFRNASSLFSSGSALAGINVKQLQPLLFSSYNLNQSERHETAQTKAATNIPALAAKMAALMLAEKNVPKRPRASLPATTNTDQLASSLQQQLRVSKKIARQDLSAAPTTTTTTTTMAHHSTTSTHNTATTPTTTASTAATTSTSTHQTSDAQRLTALVSAHFDKYSKGVVGLVCSAEVESAFKMRAGECSARSTALWEHFSEKNMPTSEACKYLLDPKFKGVCLGVDLNAYIFKELYEWVPAYWKVHVLGRVVALKEELLVFSRKVLEDCIKLVEARSGGSSSSAAGGFQQYPLLQYCQSAMERSIHSKLQEFYKVLQVDPVSLVAGICNDVLVHKLLSKSPEIKGVKKYHELFVESLNSLPFIAAHGVRARFASIIKASVQHLQPIEQHLERLGHSLLADTGHMNNMNPNMRQYLQHRMFSNVRFGNNKASSSSSSSSSSSLPQPHSAPFSMPENDENNNMIVDDKAMVIASPFVPVIDHNAYLPSRKIISLGDLCVRTICHHMRELPAVRRSSLPEELVQKIMSYMISDEMYITLKQLDDAILNRLLDSSVLNLDLENSKNITASSCLEISRLCPMLLSLNLSKCVNVTDESLSHIASSCGALEVVNLEGCVQVGNAGVSALAHGCPNLLMVNVSGCMRVTDVSVNNLLLRCPKLHTLGLRKCTEVTDGAFMALARGVGDQLRHLDLFDCTRKSDSSVSRFGAFCPKLEVLRLSGKSITDLGVKCVAAPGSLLYELGLAGCENITDEAIQFIGRNCASIHNLDLTACKVISNYAFFSPQQRDTYGATWSELEQLNLSKCINITDSLLVSLSARCDKIFSINLANCSQITDASLIQIAKFCHCVIEIDLSGCKNITDLSVSELTKSCPIRKLVLASCVNITDASLYDIATYCPNLIHLECSLCDKITDQGIEKISQGCAQLRVLCLEECNITDVGIASLAGVVDGHAHACEHLDTLKIACCRQVTDVSLGKLARGCPRVRVLDLSHCSNLITVAGLRDALKIWSHLQTLRLRGYHLSSESIIDGVHPSLKVLNLSWCRNIEDSAIVKISNTCPSLENFDITRCTKVTNTGVQELAANCSNLRQLHISGCKDVTQALVQTLVNIGKMIYL